MSTNAQLKSKPDEQLEPVDIPAIRPSCRHAVQLRHQAWLGVCSCIIVAAFLLRVRGTDDVVISSVTLPQLCNMKRFTGLDCPGCGLTRSFISMAHAEWQSAWNFHAAGPIWFVVVVAQIPFRIWQLLRIRKGQDEFQTGLEWQFLIGMFALLLVVWIFKMLLG